jgi:hypothetical protein
MTDAPNPQPSPIPAIPQEQSQEIRRLAHDLSNALEIIVQTSYLISTLELDENGTQWAKMLDSGVRQAVTLNRELREYVRRNS